MGHRAWMDAAREEYRRWDALLADLGEGDWGRPTDCPEWDVRQVVSHLVGAAEGAAGVRELVRQQRLGRRLRPGGPTVDAMNALQVHERAGTPPDRLRRDLRDAGARAVRSRARIPAPVRALPVPFGEPIGTRRLGYLTDRIYTRDAWMHRVDVSRATGRSLTLTGPHDGRIVADVVSEWASLHRRPFTLDLTGPAGGTWSRGDGGPHLERDAVEFCRALSGRGPGDGVLGCRVPF